MEIGVTTEPFTDRAFSILTLASDLDSIFLLYVSTQSDRFWTTIDSYKRNKLSILLHPYLRYLTDTIFLTRANTYPATGAICPMFFLPNGGIVFERIDGVLTGGKGFGTVGRTDGDQNADFAHG